jgi:hypothetical protein
MVSSDPVAPNRAITLGGKLIASKLEQPDLDNRSYRVVRLQNNLEVLIVHDPDTDKASAALDVHVGNFSDKEDLQVSNNSILPRKKIRKSFARQTCIARVLSHETSCR